MSLGGRLILLLQDLNRKTCQRCGLPYDRSHSVCPHCKDLNDFEVSELKEKIGIDDKLKGIPWSFLVLVGIILLALLLFKTIV